MRFLNTALYIALIVFVNWAFVRVNPIPLPGGGVWQPVALIVGFAFVVRDFAQREIGHYVLAAMGVGVALSYFMASPAVAMASATAFLIGELADWAVYSFTRRPLSQRIFLSSLIGAPVDSVVFLWMLDFLDVATLAAMIASKMLGAFAVWCLIRRREAVQAA